MRLSLIFALCLSLAPLALAAQTPCHDDWPPAGACRDRQFLCQELQSRLRLWEENFIPLLPPERREQARNLSGEIRSLLLELAFAPEYWTAGWIAPLAPEDFELLRQSVKNAWFSDDMLDRLRLAAEDNRFTSRQVVDLLNLFYFDDDKLDALEIVWPRCLDRGNKFIILDCFAFDSDRDAALELMSGQN